MTGISTFTFRSDIPLKEALFGSIKGRLLILFIVTFVSIVALTAVNFWNLSKVKAWLLLGERYDDLLNDILEVRRFEKNFIFLNDGQSLSESMNYLKRINGLVDDLSSDLKTVADKSTIERFERDLAAYEKNIGDFSDGKGGNPEELRHLGKSLLDTASGFLSTKRTHIHRVVVRTSILPFVLLAGIVLLMILVIKLIKSGLLKPLDVIISMIQRVARGDFTPIKLKVRQMREIRYLIGAFNRMAEELEKNQEDLLQARKISALGTFTAGIAHELNNPINNIVLTAESFAEDYADKVDEEGRDMLKDILAQAERAADIVKNLLDFSRTERPAFSRLSPSQVIESTVNLVKNQIKLAGLRLDMKIFNNLPRINGNLRNLQQVFMNLLLNAIQVSPPGGVITVLVEPWMKGYICFQVRDSGPGISPEIRQQIFEPFFSTKEVGKGTGLGLAVTYSLIKRHGGRIEVANDESGGAVFSVFLPVALEDETVFIQGENKP
jgi:signal transduction histidine kinase